MLIVQLDIVVCAIDFGVKLVFRAVQLVNETFVFLHWKPILLTRLTYKTDYRLPVKLLHKYISCVSGAMNDLYEFDV